MKYLRVLVTFLILLLSTDDGYSREYEHLQFNNSLKKSDSMVNILSQLHDLLGDTHDEIGAAEVERILDERDLGEGVLNYGGFSWYKPMLNFEVAAKRQIAPEIHSDRWIVHDSLTLFIDAATLLSNLRAEGTINITDKALELFVGLTFTRKYHYYHFAPTYSDALRSDFSKLFLSFTRFEADSMFLIKNEEILSREDKFEMSAKIAGNIPITTGMTLGMAASATLAFRNAITYQHVKDEGLDESFRLSQKSATESEMTSHLSVKLDFLGVLQATLLSHDLQYNLTKTSMSFLSLTSGQVKGVLNDPAKKLEIADYLKGSTDLESLKDYEVSYEQRKKENYKSKFSFLLLGKIRKRSLEQIKILKSDTEKIFYKSYSESIDYVQSFFSKLYSAIVNKIFKIGQEASNNLEVTKNVSFEYEGFEDFTQKTKGAETLSIHIAQSFEANSINKESRRKKAVKHLKLLTNLDYEYEKKINEKILKAPMKIIANLEVGTKGILYLNSLTDTQALPILFNVCNVESKDIDNLITEKTRDEIFSGKLDSSLRCAKKLSKYYFDYREDFKSSKNINIKRLKTLLEYALKKANSFHELFPLFGVDNVFIHGEFLATTNKGLPYRTHFKSGQFKEFGVIDRFKLN